MTNQSIKITIVLVAAAIFLGIEWWAFHHVYRNVQDYYRNPPGHVLAPMPSSGRK